MIQTQTKQKRQQPNPRQILFNNSQPMQSYLTHLQERYGISISYGNVTNVYNILPVFKQLANRRRIEDYEQFVYYFSLPNNEFLDDVKLCYSTIFCKYFITSYDKNKQLQVLEYLNVESVEKIIEVLSKEFKYEN